jgi:2-methylisocitrate lyase-like PEP mutase family enzyme
MLTARAENFLWGRPDLDETIARLRAFVDVGADVVYAPGLRTLADIEHVCRSVDRPVNVVMGLTGLSTTVADLDEVGVKRISVGGSFARAAMTGFIAAAREVREHGTFTYSDRIISDSDAGAFMQQHPR